MTIGSKMTEIAEITRQPFIPQERREWYKVNSLLGEIEDAAQELGLKPEEMVHIGGISIFYHAYRVFGPRALVNFRGTHDMDIITFTKGAMQRIFDKLTEDPNSHVREYHLSRSHLPDKRTLHIALKDSNFPGFLPIIDIDYWEFTSGAIAFNDRRMEKTRIVLDPPEKLELATLNPYKRRGLVVVPSLRDTFIIKMDVVDYSRLGLRPKDRIDVLTMLSTCNALGHDFDYLLDALVSTSSQKSALMKLGELENVFANPDPEIEIIGRTNPLLPSGKQIAQALRRIKYYKQRIS